MARRVYAGAILSVVTILSYLCSRAFQTQAQSIRQPFTMIMVSQGSQAARESGKELRGIRTLLAVRSDGSSATVSLEPDGDLKSLPQFGDRSLILRLQRQHVYLLDRLKLKTTTAIQVGNVIPPPHPTCLPADQGMSKFVKEDTVLGWPAFVYESIHTGKDGTITKNTRWFAPVLNCRDMQGRLDITDAAGRVKTLWNRPASVSPGEPDAALFAVPDEYREVSPGEMERERARVAGRTALPSSLEERLKSKDEAYSRARPK